MKNVLSSPKFPKLSLTTLSFIFCISVLSSCGSSKSAKREETKAVTPTVETAPTETATSTGTSTNAPTTSGSDGAPLPTSFPAESRSQSENGEVAAPKGRPNPPKTAEENKETKENETTKKTSQTQTADFKQDAFNKTGGQSGNLFYTSAADDGLMAFFKQNSTTVSKEQQASNLALATSVVGAKFIKTSSGGELEIVTTESGETKFYKMIALIGTDGKMNLSSVQSTGQNQFQAGYVKCLNELCDDSYARLKMSGSYIRIIFRTAYAHNNFGILVKSNNSKYELFKSYITNTTQGLATDQRIESIRMASYEVLNGKSAMGVQILTEDQEALSFNMLLVAPEKGSSVDISAKKVIDLSTNYDLPSTKNKKMNLSNSISEAQLVNNNGRGQVKLKLLIEQNSLDLTLIRKSVPTLTPEQVKAFDSKISL